MMKRLLTATLLLGCMVALGTANADAAPKKKTATASAKGFKDPVTGMEFVYVTGGCYMMGDVFNDKNARKDEQPVHEVCVDGFYMGRYEVTQGQYTEIMGKNPSRYFGENRPVEMVSWDDAQQFIAKLNEKSGKQYRLPTEAEWEYAARSGGKKEKWAGTSNEKELNKYAWYSLKEGQRIQPVGQKRPNGLGLYDMTGNVWEWCNDWYGESAYDDDAIKDKPRNPQGPDRGSYRVYRGGILGYYEGRARAALRNYDSPGGRSDSVGFRLVSP